MYDCHYLGVPEQPQISIGLQAAAIFSKTVPSGFAGVHKFRIAHNTVALSIPNAGVFLQKLSFFYEKCRIVAHILAHIKKNV